MIEMVANALQVNEGRDVDALLTNLQGEYHLHSDVLSVASYGDCSNRKRLFIIGFCKEQVGEIGKQYQFPEPEFDASKFFTARDIAIPDWQVPEKYWLKEDIGPFHPLPRPRPLCIHKIGQIRPGMGPSWRPYAVQTHDGIYPTQTTHNGGGRRVPLSWQYGDKISDTRITVPIEAAGIASLPDDYVEWARSFDDSDEFLFKAINMGIPLRTATAIDSSVHDLLVKAGITFDIDDDNVPESAMGADEEFHTAMENQNESWIGLMRHIRSIQ